MGKGKRKGRGRKGREKEGGNRKEKEGRGREEGKVKDFFLFPGTFVVSALLLILKERDTYYTISSWISPTSYLQKGQILNALLKGDRV